MSNYLAVATVTAVLRQLLKAAVDVDVPGAAVGTDRPQDPSSVTGAGIDIYLFQVRPQRALVNEDLPARDGSGALVQRPTTALDLDYLLTFYGDEKTLEPQRLLGTAVRTLEERPLVTSRMIRDAVANPAFPFLAGSDLADALDKVRFTLSPLSLEDLSKLWSVFFQVPHSLALAYRASLVRIEGNETPRPGLPVREVGLHVRPFTEPIVETVEPDAGIGEPIVHDSTLVITGLHLRGDQTRVRLAGEEVAPQTVTSKRAVLPLNSVPAASLRAGVQGLQIVHSISMGTPPLPHRGAESGVFPFVLRPTITARQVKNAQEENGSGRFSADVELTLAPRVGKSQRVSLLLNEFGAPVSRAPRAYVFDAPSRDLPAAPDSVATLEVPITGVAAGDYLLRVVVDGAESVLERENNQASPDFGKYVGPQENIS
jgi:hypothetical protein